MKRIAVIVSLVIPTVTWAAPENLVPTWAYVPTQVPYTHILDYSADIFSDEYLAALADGPPHLITHHQLTIAHPYFGPMCDLAKIRAGEPEMSAEEAVEAYREQRARVAEYIRRAHEAGVQVVTSYICLMSTGGEPDRRLGIWRFYDHWDAFAEFNVPPKPADPITWQQRKPDGSEHHFYQKEHPPYAPMFRYSNCVNNPGWQTWVQWVVEEAARAGLDGVFVDNGGSLRCYCEYCRAGFDAWLRERYTPAEIAELFGGDTSMAEDLSATDLRRAETELFWQESIHRHLARIRAWGSAIRGSFFIYPNGLHGRPHYIATRSRDADLGMDENSSGAFGGNPGVARRHVVAGLYARHVNDDMLAYRHAPGSGSRCRVSNMPYAGYPRSDEANLGPNANTGVLGLAEAAGLGGGGSYLMYRPAQHPWMSAVRATMNDFFARNADLYAGRYPWGQVAIFAPVLPNYFGDARTFQTAGNALQVLAGRGLLVDLLTENTLSPQALARYRAVIVPGVRIMSDTQMAMLVDYTRTGGTLVLVGDDNADRDQFGRERPPADRAALFAAATATIGPTMAELAEDGALELPKPLRAADQGELVRFAAYVDNWDAPTDMTVHCVNYDVDIGAAHDRVGSVEGLRLSIPLPLGTTATSATLKAPGAEDLELPITAGAGVTQVTIPRLDIYAFVHLKLERR